MRAKNTRRTSFDLTEENSNYLGAYSKETGSSYSRIVNYMLRIFLGLYPDLKNELAEFCDSKREDLENNMPLMSEFEKQEADQKIKQYQALTYFFLQGHKPKKHAPQNDTSDNMRTIYLKKGYVLIPEDWVILDNYSTASDCMYAGVVETREPIDGKKKYNAKHFVYFTDYQYGKDYPADMDAAIYEACCEKDPAFKDVISHVVKPVYEGKAVVANMKNIAEYSAAPCPGLFHIVVKGDPIYWNEVNPDYKPPFGAMIIR